MKKERKFWIIAGEASGDMYGARLATEIKRQAALRGEEAVFAGMGGPAMLQSGLIDVKVDSTELGVIGIIEVVKHIFTFIGIFFKLVRSAAKARPEAVILIDYPGFNLLFALMMYRYKIPVIWYVCPHLWVWGKWRLPVLAKICSRMLVIFPFEVDVFAHTRLNAEFVGHPLLDIIREKHDPALVRDPDTFLLLPGSRTMEVTRLMIPMLATVTRLHAAHPNLKFVLSAPREKITMLCRDYCDKFRRKNPDCPAIEIVTGETARYQQLAATGLAASGTVTVESVISGLPLVVCYKLNTFTLLLASLVVRLYRGYFTMVNIIADKTVYEEFLQWQVSADKMTPALEKILPGGSRRQVVEAEMTEVVRLLSPGSRSAIEQAAAACLDGRAPTSALHAENNKSTLK